MHHGPRTDYFMSRRTRYYFDFDSFWSAPYRPLFLAAFVCAFLTLAWWPLGVSLGLPAPLLYPNVLWHIHELIFGFTAAAIGGYLLTALSSWTSRPPPSGAILKALVLVWALARAATALGMVLPLTIPLILNAFYFLGLAGLISHQVISARAYQKLWFVAVIMTLGCGEALFLSEAFAGRFINCLYLSKIILICLILLMTSIGARAIPAFTHNWLIGMDYEGTALREKPLSRIAALFFLSTALAMKVLGYDVASHVALIVAGLSIFWTMTGWKSVATISNPLLAAQHLAFIWLPIGTLIMGFIELGLLNFPLADGLHTITIGGISGLVMAIAGRAGSHTENGSMRAGVWFVMGVSAIWLTTWLRLIAPLFPAYAANIEVSAAILWCTGWLTFILGFTPTLFGPARRPVLSGRKHQSPEAVD